MGKNSWATTSRFWGPNRTYVEADDSGPFRPSPIRQMSSSKYTEDKTETNSFLTLTDSNNENAGDVPVKKAWSSATTSNGLFSRHRAQPLSPTKQRQNLGMGFLSNDAHAEMGDSGLFAGSSPDFEEDAFTVPQSQNGSLGFNNNSRFGLSPPSAYGRGEVDSRMQALNTSRFNENGLFTSLADYNDGRQCLSNAFQSPDASARPYLPHDGCATTSGAVVRGQPGAASVFQPATPSYRNAGEQMMGAEHLDIFQASGSSHQQFDEAMHSLRALRLGPAQEPGAQIPAPPRTSVPQAQHPRDILVHPVATHVSAQPGPFNSGGSNRFHAFVADIPGIACQPNQQIVHHYSGLPYGGRGALSPLTTDPRSSVHSPAYSTSGTPPTGPQSSRSTSANGIASRAPYNDSPMGDRKHPALEQYGPDFPHFTQNTLPTHMPNGFPCNFQRTAQPLRMNPLAHPYVAPVHPRLNGYPTAPRMLAREADQTHVARSPLLEEFRASGKTNRRFELKDIYNHVVEFSGDQHASRFIQLKLETANSDEKEQIFKEIQPNVLQLMTDVFGNYVIQKLFEHGNQAQKKALANQMKGHVLQLSMQMYGCRVVQKAFDHVLTDQQASLVKELDGPNQQILKVVKDNNGNHVVQKAIERIPGEHIQFIVDAHRGQMLKMSTHQYGCRVVQRMLEHCRPEAKRAILDELLEHTLPLISDSFGNYVVQHIIQNGEPHDRRRVVDVVLQHVLAFSKHKFASNIVEKSIEHADADQRSQILHALTAPDEHGNTPVLGLMKDQYGNYVLQKVHDQLQGAELSALREDMKRNFLALRRTSYGKQVMAMEKLLYGGECPSPEAAYASTCSPNSTKSSSNGGDAQDVHTYNAGGHK
ncbi:Pumilio-like protein 2 [Exophiala dermatitidis]